MPHITIKTLAGKSEEVKNLCVEKVAKAMQEALGASDKHISVSVEDYSPQEWQDVYANEIENNPNLRKKPDYDPKSFLK